MADDGGMYKWVKKGIVLVGDMLSPIGGVNAIRLYYAFEADPTINAITFLAERAAELGLMVYSAACVIYTIKKV